MFFYDFLTYKSIFGYIYTQNGNFSIFEDVLTLWRKSEVIH